MRLDTRDLGKLMLPVPMAGKDRDLSFNFSASCRQNLMIVLSA